MESSRHCVTCKHVRNMWGEELVTKDMRAYCKLEVDPVYGQSAECKDARSNEGECGPGGKLWEARDTA